MDYHSSMKTLHIQLEDETHRLLKRYAADNGGTMREVVTVLIKLLGEAYASQLKNREQVATTGTVDTQPTQKIIKKSVAKSDCPEHHVDGSVCMGMKHKTSPGKTFNEKVKR